MRSEIGLFIIILTIGTSLLAVLIRAACLAIARLGGYHGY